MSTYDKIMNINSNGRASTQLPSGLKKYDIPLHLLYGYTTADSMVRALKIPDTFQKYPQN